MGLAVNKDDFEHRYLLLVCKSGQVTFRERGSERGGCGHNGTTICGLPVFSVDTREEAIHLQLLHCRCASDGSGKYYLNEFGGELDDLYRVGKMFKESIKQYRRKRKE